MKDTIDLLDTIGRDALLRHASTEELTKMLAQANASGALTSAVALGDSSQLLAELGCEKNMIPQVLHSPAREEEPDEEQPLEVPVPDQAASSSEA